MEGLQGGSVAAGQAGDVDRGQPQRMGEVLEVGEALEVLLVAVGRDDLGDQVHRRFPEGAQGVARLVALDDPAGGIRGVPGDAG